MTERRLRIRILGLHYSPEQTGNAPYTTSLAEGLAAEGHDIAVVTSHPHYPEWRVRDGYGGWKTRDDRHGVRVERLAHYVPAQPSNVQRLLSEISFGLRLLFTRWGRPDVILLVSPALISSAIASVRARWGIRRPPVVVWVQDIYSLGVRETGTAGGSAARVLGAIEAWTLRGASAVVVIHDRFKGYVVNTLGVDESRAHVVRNWTHLSGTSKIDRAAVRRGLGWGDHEIVVLHAGNQGTKQGLENVIDAARIADGRSAPVRFVLLGDGNQRQRLSELAKGVERVQFVPPLSGELYQHAMAASDVLLVNERPGVNEMSVPSKLTSYFSTGLPVVAATDSGSVTADEMRDSGGGVRVDAADPVALVAAVLALGADHTLARTLGANGLQYRHDVLGQRAAIDRYSQVIHDVHAQQS